MSQNKFGSSTLPGDEISQKSSPGRQNVRSDVSKAKNRGCDLSKRDVTSSPLYLTSKWQALCDQDKPIHTLESDHHLTPLLLKLNNIHISTREPTSKVSQDVIKRTRDGNRRVVKTSVTEPTSKEKYNNKSTNKETSPGRKSIKDEIMSNPVLDAQVDSILSFMQDNDY